MLSRGEEDVRTHALTRWMVLTAAVPAEMELIMKQGRTTHSVLRRRAADMDPGGRRLTFTDSQVRNASRLIGGGKTTAQAVRDLGMSRASSYRWVRELPIPGVGVGALAEAGGLSHAGQRVDVFSESGSDLIADGRAGFLDGVQVVRRGGSRLGLGRLVRVDSRFQGPL